MSEPRPDPSSESGRRELEALNRRRQPSLAREFLFFLRESRKWWLLPILLIFAALGALAALAATGAAPFIYTLW